MLVIIQTWIRFAGPSGALEVFGVRLVGVTAETGRKLLLSVAALVGLTLIGYALHWVAGVVLHETRRRHARFWWRQAIRLVTAGLSLLALCPSDLTIRPA